MFRPASAVVLVMLVGGCSSRPREEDVKAKGSALATSAVPASAASVAATSMAASATAQPSAKSSVSSPPSASAVADPVPLPENASERPKLQGAMVFVGKVKGEGPALYAASLDVLPLEPKRIAENGSDWSIGEPSIDPSGKTVLYTHDHHENGSAPPDEVWAVSTTGGDAHRIAKCTATCRSPRFLEDARILYVDHGLGLHGAVVRMATANGKSSAVYGGDASISACFVGLDVDPMGKYVVVRVSNDLGWPECKMDRSFAASATDLKLSQLPASVPGRSLPRAGSDGRVYFMGGTDESPMPSSIRIDGAGLRAPDSAFDGQDLPRTAWSVAIDGRRIVARPPAGDTKRSVVIFEAEELESYYQTPVR